MRIGVPRFLLTDGAMELYESADVREKPGQIVIVLRDLKHFAAKTIEKLIGKNDRFTDYLSRLRKTRNAIQ